ncbi:MAG: hypothetical protein LJE84_00605 [Gammaproteobacteria bacterium]|jgi:hypothetical protein|nr:hypothetical protein [Gammaproteobacteria bacterium]
MPAISDFADANLRIGYSDRQERFGVAGSPGELSGAGAAGRDHPGESFVAVRPAQADNGQGARPAPVRPPEQPEKPV